MGKLLSELNNGITKGLLEQHFDFANWSVGKQPTILRVPNGKGGTELKIKAISIHADMSIVSNDTELLQAKTIRFKDVFDKWKRVSIKNGNPHAVPAEEDAWTYDAASDSVTCTINSASTVGFISDGTYDDFTFELELNSVHGDDDSMGIIVAYVEEGSISHSLMLYRSASTVVPVGQNPAFPFGLAYEGPTAQKYVVGGVVGNLVFPNGTAIPAAGITTNGLNGGWDLLGPIRLKVVRTPTSITCYSANKGSTTYDAANSFTVNLNSDPRLAKFMEPCSIGYIAYSQPEATFKAIQQPGLKLPIIDQRDNSLWLWSGTAWVKNTMTAANRPYKPGQIVRSAVNGKSFVANNGNALIQMGKFTPE